MSSSSAYIVESQRTPVGKYGGSLSTVRPDDMGAHVIKAVVEKSGIPADVIDDVIMGCANQAGEDNRNVSRMSALLAGLPYSVPGVTVNRLCASSLEAVIQGMRAIRSNEGDVLVVGGMESMTRAPYSIPKNVGGASFGNITGYDTALGWRYPNKKMEALFPLESMGETGENVAERWGITREEQDEFAYRSHQRAIIAQQAGKFVDEIAPVTIPAKKGDDVLYSFDECPRADTSIEKLSTLKPVFRKNGTVTAGNSSSLNDGAVAILMCSDSALKSYNLTPMARVLSSGQVGVDPRIMGIGPVEAIRLACKRAGITVADLGLVEINEAFASQSIACMRELNLDPETTNVNGGSIAIGHPLGMSGGRIAAHLAREMQRRNVRYGAAALCIGVGQGLAIVLERV